MSTLAVVQQQPEDFYAEVGARVHQLMWSKRITQTAMAPRMGIAQSVLGRKLRGAVTWTARDLVAAAAILEVDVNDLVPQYGRPTPTEPSVAGVQPTD